MQNNLFLLCPTDCLEPIVNNTFKEENYFYTSLGNSLSLDTKTLEYIKELIINHNISNIYMVLSNDNQIVLDALKGQSFSDIRGLKTFYNNILELKKQSETSWQNNNQFTVLSYYINSRIHQLQNYLSFLLDSQIKFYGKIYNKQEAVFNNIYSELVCVENRILN